MVIRSFDTSCVDRKSFAMAEFQCLEQPDLERFLERRRASPTFPPEMSLAENLVAVLRKANELVPSEAGSILLDDPVSKSDDRADNSLTFIASFGELSEILLGNKIAVSEGIAGRVYVSGQPYSSTDAERDNFSHSTLDSDQQFQTRSMVAIPIRIEKEICGVLELVNRSGAESFSPEDLNLLQIFAGYISISIQNVLDGRQARRFAQRENLTGLFNDRYLHLALTRTIESCQKHNQDLSLLFIDLDFFKRVNDTHGHLTGSQVLREVGRLLERHTNASLPNGLAARYGGDEFVVAIPGLDLDRAIDLAERVRSSIATSTFCVRPSEIQPDPHHLTGITCSIGLASLLRHAWEASSVEACKATLLRLADAAMYVAKDTGRNRSAVAGEPVHRRRHLVD